MGVEQGEYFPPGRPHIFFICSSIQRSEVGRGLIQIKWPPPQSQRLTPEKKTLISLKAALGESDEGDHDRRPGLYCRFRLASYLWHRHTLTRTHSAGNALQVAGWVQREEVKNVCGKSCHTF